MRKWMIEALLWLVVVGLVLYAYAHDISLTVPLEAWDAIATAGWALVPLSLTYLLVAIAHSVQAYRYNLNSHTAANQYNVELAAAQVKLMEAQAGEAEALMWESRHRSKKARDN